MSQIVNRLGSFIKFKNLSIRKFEGTVGMTYGALSRAIQKDTDIQSEWLEAIIENNPDLNPDWLLTGSGDMIRSSVYQITGSNSQPDGSHFQELLKAKEDEIEVLKQLVEAKQQLIDQMLGK